MVSWQCLAWIATMKPKFLKHTTQPNPYWEYYVIVRDSSIYIYGSVRSSGDVNFYGNEEEYFLNHFSFMYERKIHTTCSNATCPQINDTLLEKSDPSLQLPDDTSSTVEEEISNWFTPSKEKSGCKRIMMDNSSGCVVNVIDVDKKWAVSKWLFSNDLHLITLFHKLLLSGLVSSC